MSIIVIIINFFLTKTGAFEMEVKKNKVIAAITLALSAISFPAYADFSFDCETGLAGTFCKSQNSGKIALTMNGFVSGQVNMTDKLFARAEIAVKTDDILDGGIFEDTASGVSMNKLSLNYSFHAAGMTHVLSVFSGYEDSVGTDTYLRRMLGTNGVASPITESHLGSDGIAIYPLKGSGISYNARFSSVPAAAGAYIYKNDETSDETSQTNVDFRFATALKYLTMDFAFGMGIPITRELSTGEKVFLLIDRVNVHSGITLIIGNRNSTSLFVQGGFYNREVESLSDLADTEMKDVFLLVEPRFKFNGSGIHFTFFNIPGTTLGKIVESSDGTPIFAYTPLTYMEMSDTLGGNITFISRETGAAGIRFGMHTMLTLEGRHLGDLGDKSELSDCIAIKMMPFVSFPVMGGTMTTTARIKATKFSESGITVGFKKSI